MANFLPFRLDSCAMDNVVKQSRYLITSLRYVVRSRYVAKATSRAALTRREIIVPAEFGHNERKKPAT